MAGAERVGCRMTGKADLATGCRRKSGKFGPVGIVACSTGPSRKWRMAHGSLRPAADLLVAPRAELLAILDEQRSMVSAVYLMTRAAVALRNGTMNLCTTQGGGDFAVTFDTKDRWLVEKELLIPSCMWVVATAAIA